MGESSMFVVARPGRAVVRLAALVALGGLGVSGCSKPPAPAAPTAPATTTAPAPATVAATAPPTAAPGTTAPSAGSAPATEAPSPLDLARAPNVVGPPVAFTATGPADKKLPDLTLSLVGEADTFHLGVTASPSGSPRFGERLNTCSEGSVASFGPIEWTLICGGQKIVRKIDNACDPCTGEAGALNLKRKDAAACWQAGQAPEVAVKFAIDGVTYEATSRGPDLSAAGSTTDIARKLEKAGVKGVGVFGEACCPAYPAAQERAGTLTVGGKTPTTFPYVVYWGTPERFPSGPVCQHSGQPDATLSYGFPSHRFDVVLLDDEAAPLTGAAKETATAALDLAFKAAGGLRIEPGKP
jgi:hypothetical protein